MLDTFTAIAGALACAGTGFACGLIAGRSAVTVIRRETSEQGSLALLAHNCGPPVVPQPRQKPRTIPPSLRVTMPREKGPVYAVQYHGEWYYTQAATEIKCGQLRHWEYGMSGHVEWVVPYGSWVRMK